MKDTISRFRNICMQGDPASASRDNIRRLPWWQAAVLGLAMIALVVATDLGPTWLQFTTRLLFLSLAAMLVLSMCLEAISQTRSNWRQFTRGSSPPFSTKKRLLTYTLTVARAVFAAGVLCGLALSWIRSANSWGFGIILILMVHAPGSSKEKTSALTEP